MPGRMPAFTLPGPDRGPGTPGSSPGGWASGIGAGLGALGAAAAFGPLGPVAAAAIGIIGALIGKGTEAALTTQPKPPPIQAPAPKFVTPDPYRVAAGRKLSDPGAATAMSMGPNVRLSAAQNLKSKIFS